MLSFIKTWILMSLLLASLVCEVDARDKSLKLIEESVPAINLNWLPLKPKIVVALGYLESNAKNFFLSKEAELQDKVDKFGRAIGLRIDLELIPIAKTHELVLALKDPNTIGLVIVAHSFQTSHKSSILLGSDGAPVPREILSAALPSLQFVAFFGCHGSEVVKFYQVQYSLEKVPGRQLVAYSTSPYMSVVNQAVTRQGRAEQSMSDMLKEQNASVWDTLDEMLLNLPKKVKINNQMSPPQNELEYSLSVEVKDVVKDMEPRMVKINGTLVGVIGGDERFSNETSNYKMLTFKVPAWAIKKAERCQRLMIGSSELSVGSFADDYLIRRLALKNISNGTAIMMNEKVFIPEIHLGDDQKPFSGSMPPVPTEEDIAPFMSSKKEPPKEVAEKIVKYAKWKEWLDRTPHLWPELTGRFYSSCI